MARRDGRDGGAVRETALPTTRSLGSLPVLVLLVLLVLLALLASAGTQWWLGRQQHEIGAEVAALARPGDIRMRASDTCGVCITARQWFAENRVAFSECRIERDAACQQAFERSGSPGTPVLLVRGQALLGFSPQRLQRVLQPG